MPPGVALLVVVVGLAYVGEREDEAHHGQHVPGVHQLGQLGQLVAVGPHQHPLGPHAVLSGLLGGVAPDGHQHAAWPQHADRALEDLSSHGVEDDVEVGHDLLEALAGVVHHLVGSEGAQEVGVVGRGSADDASTLPLGELDGDVAHAPGGGVDEQALARLEVGGLEQALPGGEGDEGQGRRPHVVDGGGLGRQVLGGGGHVLGVGAARLGEAHHPEDLVARRKGVHARPGGLHHAGDVPAQGQREALADLVGLAAAGTGLPVHGIDAGGVHPDQDLTLARLGLGGVLEVHLLGTAVGVDADRLHAALSVRTPAAWPPATPTTRPRRRRARGHCRRWGSMSRAWSGW